MASLFWRTMGKNLVQTLFDQASQDPAIAGRIYWLSRLRADVTDAVAWAQSKLTPEDAAAFKARIGQIQQDFSHLL